MTATVRCATCGTELPDTLLRCPSCGTLVHAAELDALARSARALEAQGRATDAVAEWGRILQFLPGDAPQRATILEKIMALESASPREPVATTKKGGKGAWLGLGSALVFLLGKAKFLLLGLTKMSTLLSMFAFVGVYWGLYGWKFALGFALSIYVHEMGHVAALRHYGIPASAPMFIPGIGALIRLRAHPPTRSQDARVGLAGPVWGMGAASLCLGLYWLTDNGLFASLTHVGAVINAFNLIPIWQLDGSRGIAPLGRVDRGMLAAASLAVFAVTHQPMFLFVGIVLAGRAFFTEQGEGDQTAMLTFLGLLVALGYLVTVRGGLAN